MHARQCVGKRSVLFAYAFRHNSDKPVGVLPSFYDYERKALADAYSITGSKVADSIKRERLTEISVQLSSSTFYQKYLNENPSNLLLTLACFSQDESLIRKCIEKQVLLGVPSDAVVAKAVELLLTRLRMQKFSDLSLLFRFLPDFKALPSRCCDLLTNSPLLESIIKIGDLLLQFPTARAFPFIACLVDLKTTLGYHSLFDRFILRFFINSNAYDMVTLFLHSYRKHRIGTGPLAMDHIRLAFQCFEMRKMYINTYILRVLTSPIDASHPDLRIFIATSAAAPECFFSPNALARLLPEGKDEWSIAAYLENQKSRFSGLTVPPASLPPLQMTLLCINEYLAIQKYLIYMINVNIPFSFEVVLFIFQMHSLNTTINLRTASLFWGILNELAHSEEQEISSHLSVRNLNTMFWSAYSCNDFSTAFSIGTNFPSSMYITPKLRSSLEKLQEFGTASELLTRPPLYWPLDEFLNHLSNLQPSIFSPENKRIILKQLHMRFIFSIAQILFIRDTLPQMLHSIVPTEVINELVKSLAYDASLI